MTLSIEARGPIHIEPIGGEPLEGCLCQGPFHAPGCSAVKGITYREAWDERAERQRKQIEEMARMVIFDDIGEGSG